MESRGTHRRRDGSFEVCVARGGDAELSAAVGALLAHKGEPWVWHVEECLAGSLPKLDSYFYLARRDGRLVANVTVFRNGRLGNVSHVFTAPEARRQGVARTLLGLALADFESDGGEALVLGTGFESMPYRLYESLGFRPTCPEQAYGGMARFVGGADWDTVLNGPVGRIAEADWSHFVGAQLLFGHPGPEQVRSLHLPSLGPRLVEGEFIRLKHRQHAGEPLQAWVIEGGRNVVLGCAVLGPHPVWRECAVRPVLDVYVHPAGRDAAPELVRTALDAAGGEVECYVDGPGGARGDQLRALGFRECRTGPTLRFGRATAEVRVMTGGVAP